MLFDDVIGQPCDGGQVVSRRKKLEGADTHEASGGAGDDAAGQEFLPGDLFTRRHGGQCARGRHAEFCHGLADQVFTQYRPQCGAPVTAARQGRAPGPFQVDVMVNAVRSGNLAQQEGAAIPQLRNEVSELMAGIGHGQGLGTLGDTIAGKDGRALG